MLFTDVQRSVHLNKKEKSTNTSPYPDEVIDRLARAFYPAILACWNSEEGQREFAAWQAEQAHHANNEKQKVPTGAFLPRGTQSASCSNPFFYCPVKSVQNKKSSTPQGAALGATGRIRTSGLPGRRTTTGRYRLALERKLCWFCTVASKTRKSPLLVVTIGFFDILQHHCTVVVKWWSGMEGHTSRNIEYDPRHLTQRMILYTILINNKYGGA